MTEQPLDRRKLTFSQAEGIDPLPQPAELGELPEKARARLWKLIYESMKQSSPPNMIGGPSFVGEPWRSILCDYYVDVQNGAVDEFDDQFHTRTETLKKLVLEGPFNRVLDFLEFVMRHRGRKKSYRRLAFGPNLEAVLKEYQCAYTVVDGDTIVPVALPEQRESMKRAFDTLKSGSFKGAREHLRKSAKNLNAGDYADSVRNSIHAVESAARRLDAAAAKSLKPALDALARNGVNLHPAFKRAIEKLYGYTSDEDGIRHALLEKEAKVDVEDATFMFGACSSFAAYLVNKARKAGLPIQE